jgi:ABC-type transporter Mla subunit MlaD
MTIKASKQNALVGLFAFFGILILIGILSKFHNLPTQYSQLGAYQVKIYFSKIPGIETNSIVYFKGFTVGRVIKVDSPHLREMPTGIKQYQIAVNIAIRDEFQIPANAVCKLYKRGLGTSYLEFTIDPSTPVTENIIKEGDLLEGVASTGSEFISEATQVKLDNIIDAIEKLTYALQYQFNPVTPDQVDSASKAHPINPNTTTAIMRMDIALKNFNTFFGDSEMQQNAKSTLANLSQATAKLPMLIDQLDTTANNIELVFADISSGGGTTSKLIHDATLYESLTTASQKLTPLIDEFKIVLEGIRKKGILKYKGD